MKLKRMTRQVISSQRCGDDFKGPTGAEGGGGARGTENNSIGRKLPDGTLSRTMDDYTDSGLGSTRTPSQSFVDRKIELARTVTAIFLIPSWTSAPLVWSIELCCNASVLTLFDQAARWDCN